MKEEFFPKGQEEFDSIKKAMERMYDAIGVNYTSFTEVMETLDDMRLDLKPNSKTVEVVKVFKHRSENMGSIDNPVDFWVGEGKKCETVLEAVRLYLETNAQQFPGISVLKNRILFLANKGAWK